MKSPNSNATPQPFFINATRVVNRVCGVNIATTPFPLYANATLALLRYVSFVTLRAIEISNTTMNNEELAKTRL